MPEPAPSPRLVVHAKASETLQVELSGDWRGPGALPDFETLQSALGGAAVKALEFDTAKLVNWGSRFVAFINRCRDACQQRGIQFREETLPDGVRGLIRLANAVPEKKDARRVIAPSSFLHRLGVGAIRNWTGARDQLAFLGETVLAFGNLLRGRAQFRWPDAFLVMQECGPQALGIVALISFLVGLILAFVGAVALLQFGASVFVADMVAVGTVREMGCMMTGIILCGRTGAAFAAQLGTMKVNEEINAFRAFGISPLEFLVLPRMIALVLMMPLLCVFADLIGIFGGFTVSTLMLDVTPAEYIHRTIEAITLKSFLLGICKGSFFGFLIAYTGCLRGMQCGSNAAAVGEATTRAVVTGITAIIASDGIFAVLCNALDL